MGKPPCVTLRLRAGCPVEHSVPKAEHCFAHGHRSNMMPKQPMCLLTRETCGGRGEGKAQSVQKMLCEREKKLAARLPLESNSTLPFSLFLFWCHAIPPRPEGCRHFRSLLQVLVSLKKKKEEKKNKRPAECFLLRLSKWEVHNAAVSKPLFYCLGEKGIRQALQPDSLAV